MSWIENVARGLAARAWQDSRGPTVGLAQLLKRPDYDGNSTPVRRLRTSDQAMPTVRFTPAIQRHVECPTRDVSGASLRDVLDAYFREHEQARGYVLDDQGRLRHHMVAFIDGKQLKDRDRLSDRVPPEATIDIIQALSGGQG